VSADVGARSVASSVTAAAPGPHDATLRPRVGVGVIVLREDRVLLGQRTGSHGAGTWALPGGHLEFGEEVDACARREVLEETGLALLSTWAGPFVGNVFAAEQQHYVTLFVLGQAGAGEAQRLEPAKCLGWRWCAWDDLPEPLFAPLQTLVATGYRPTWPARGGKPARAVRAAPPGPPAAT